MSEELEKQKIESEENSEPKSLQIKDQDTYKFYDYMKSHPGPFVALLPIVFAAVSCVFQYIIYLHERYKAQFWNIPVKNIEINSLDIYVVGASIMFFVITSLLVGCLIGSLTAYLSKIQSSLVIDEQIKFMKEKLKICEKERTVPEGFKEGLENMKENRDELKKQYKNFYKTLRRKLFFEVAGTCLTYFVIKMILGLVDLDYYIIIEIISFFLLAGIIYLILIQNMKREIRIKIEWLLKPYLDENQSKKIMASMVDIRLSPIEWVEIKGFKSLFSDVKIKSFTCAVLFTILYYLILLQILHSEDSNKTFQIVTESDKIYAVVYQTKDIYVLESATINNNEITIDTTQQRIIKTSDFAYEVKEFSSVKRLKLDAQNEENDVSADSSTNVRDTLIEQNPPVSDLANDTTQDTINGIDDDLEKSNDNDDDSDTETETANDIDDLEKSNDNDDDSDTVAENTNNTNKNEQGIDLKNDQ